jgi:hypothetical protein
MDILLSIKNQNSQKVLAFLELLKSFDMIDNFIIVENNPLESDPVKPESDLYMVKKNKFLHFTTHPSTLKTRHFIQKINGRLYNWIRQSTARSFAQTKI